jgi:hypothetical protein
MQTASAVADTPIASMPFIEKKTEAVPSEPIISAPVNTASGPITLSAPIELTVAPTAVELPRLSASLNALNQVFLAGNGAMQQFFSKLSTPTFLTNSSSNNSAAATKPFSSEQIVHKQRFENQLSLKLMTKEGDQIRVHLFSAASAQQYKAQVSSANLQISEQQQTSQTQTQFSFYVEGDLNAEELSAIDDYTRLLSAAVNSFFHQDLDSAVRALTHAQIDGQQIASVDFSLRSKAVATYTRTYQTLSGIPPQTPAWQQLDQYFNDVLIQQAQLPPSWQNPFLEHLLATLDEYQQWKNPLNPQVENAATRAIAKSVVQPRE